MSLHCASSAWLLWPPWWTPPLLPHIKNASPSCQREKLKWMSLISAEGLVQKKGAGSWPAGQWGEGGWVLLELEQAVLWECRGRLGPLLASTVARLSKLYWAVSQSDGVGCLLFYSRIILLIVSGFFSAVVQWCPWQVAMDKMGGSCGGQVNRALKWQHRDVYISLDICFCFMELQEIPFLPFTESQNY